MATPQEMGAYYDGHPDPDDPSTWGGAKNFAEAKATFTAVKGPPPTPAPVRGPPSPGAGMPAARIGDLCAHGGPVVGPGCPTVLIGYMPAVRAMPAMDSVACPMFDGVVPHATGTILKGSNTVLIGNFPAARVSDQVGPPSNCKGNAIAMGCTTVLIGDSGGSGGGGASAPAAPVAPPPPADEVQDEEAEYSDEPPENPPPGEPTQEVGKGTHWLEIEMVDEADEPVVGEAYQVRMPDGKEWRGSLDARGRVRFTGIKGPGSCQIAFPNLDLAAWERWRPGPSTPAGTGAASPPPLDSSSSGTVAKGAPARGGQWRTVRQGECTNSIAKDTGHFWQTLWDHAANAELKKRRGDPNVLLRGDAVFVPDKRPKEETGNTDAHHKFRRRGEPAWLRLKLMDRSEPLAGEPYVLEIDGKRREGVTDAEGMLLEPIPGNARRAMLEVGGRRRYLRLGGIDPINEVCGVQKRLNNLGFPCGRVDGILGPKTLAALNHFRKLHALPESDRLDPAVMQKLLDIHDRMQPLVQEPTESIDEDLEPPGTDEDCHDLDDDLSDLDVDNEEE